MAQEKAQQTQKTMDQIMEEQRQAKMDQPSSVTVTPPKVEDVPAMTSGPKTETVSMPTGTSVPGCEETNTCFIPSSVKINVGDTVSWSNDDTAAHTVTSGKPANGPDGNFDSSLLMVGKTFDVTFDNAGKYDYFCMVHPWMVGEVQVN
jgi:plastocyanin